MFGFLKEKIGGFIQKIVGKKKEERSREEKRKERRRMTRQKVTAIVILLALLLVAAAAGTYAKMRTNPATVFADGQRHTVFVQKGQTVSVALTQAGVTLGPLDRVEPGLAEPVSPGAVVKVTRVEIKTRFEDVALPYSTEVNRDDS
ncbi:MAG: ubiquitin-like domain-containing protein, partial [Candidatus Micrarchaeia archaeon]